jgi:hypothetical protein
VETKNKLNRKIDEGEIREGSELRDERARIVKVKRRILATEDVLIANKIIDEETKKIY